jgi:hypothetical protein
VLQRPLLNLASGKMTQRMHVSAVLSTGRSAPPSVTQKGLPQWAFVVAMDLAAVTPRETTDREGYGGSSLRRLTLLHGYCTKLPYGPGLFLLSGLVAHW